jgi:hypothetical protein
VDALLEDPVVQQRIQQDPELRAMWHEPGVRQHAAMAPQMMAGMAKLLELVHALSEDPAVQRRIQADAELRELWSEPGVRQRIQPPAQP